MTRSTALLGAFLGLLLSILAAPVAAQVDGGVAAPDAADAPQLEPTGEEAAPTRPQHVVIGAYVNQIPLVDLKGNQFTIDFWLWCRWRGGARNPLDNAELVGGRVVSRGNVVRRTLADGTEYAAARITATFNRAWDLSRFPFDDHVLTIVVEDAELPATELVYEVDHANSDVDPELVVSGWLVGDHTARTVEHVYQSNYGDPTLSLGPESRYARFELGVTLRRAGVARFFKVFFGLFVATLVSWAAFLFRPKEASSRVSVSIGALFAAAASSIAINAQLPDVNGITLADEIVFLCMSSILVGLVLSIVSLRVSDHPEAVLARRIDRAATLALPLVVLAALAYVVSG